MVSFSRKLDVLNLIEVDRERILANFDEVKKKTGKMVWPVLKANAYGAGLEQVAEVLKGRDFEYWVVDSIYEAQKIWKIDRRRVLLIGPMLPGNYRLIDWERVTIMVQSVEEIEMLGELDKDIKIHLKVNTGMNRQGIEVGELERVLEVVRKYKNLELEGVMSHLAGFDDKKQEKRFEKVIGTIEKLGLRPKYYHLGATSGVGIKTGNVIRLGMGLYQGAIRLMSKVVKVRRVKTGEKISYNGTYKFKRDAWVGVVPVGYYEGLDRRLSNRGWVKYEDKFYRIVGNVCMNMCLVNFGNLRPEKLGEVEVIGREGKNSVAVMAKAMGTIDYEVMVGLSQSIRRKIV